jgi:RsiW-degrading membrane proteinase PrsW (M82 family)
MGYQLGRAKFSVKNVKFIFILSLLLPILYHGFFNYLLLLLDANWLWLMVPVMIILWVSSLWTVQQANANSPFRMMNLDDKIRI